MEKVEEINPYDASASKGKQVEAMFDNIASAYDFMNAAMSFGLHRFWRNRALKMLAPKPGARLLDMATGTGDVAIDLARRYSPDAVIGLDLSAGMLAEAKKKAAAQPQEIASKLSFAQGDCLDIKEKDASFDAVTVAYGVRNFENLEAGLKEMCRVLKPGGKLCIIELSEPTGWLTRPCYKLYSRRIIPAVGRMVSGDSRAYTYLPESIAACPQRDAMTDLMLRAGFREANWKSLTFGVVSIYIGVK